LQSSASKALTNMTIGYYYATSRYAKPTDSGEKRSKKTLLGLVRAGIAGDRSSGSLLSASCNLQLSYAEDPIAAINTLLYLRIAYGEHAERTYIAEIDEGPNIINPHGEITAVISAS
jgi:hypothetical protein